MLGTADRNIFWIDTTHEAQRLWCLTYALILWIIFTEMAVDNSDTKSESLGNNSLTHTIESVYKTSQTIVLYSWFERFFELNCVSTTVSDLNSI